jgi:spore maturation protein CgeB
MSLDIVIFGLSITSSWGNGHATTYRALAKALADRGHRVTFLERDVPWYRKHRDLKKAAYCAIHLYQQLKEAPGRFSPMVREADLVILGSFVPEGAELAEWIVSQARGVTAFYDIDTPVTFAQIRNRQIDYIRPAQIPKFDLYLSFTGGPVLQAIEEEYGSPRARSLYCSVDPLVHSPSNQPAQWDLGYLGTYSKDRQPKLEKLLLATAVALPERRFVVAGAQYPAGIAWPKNVERSEHLPPAQHPDFYCRQRYTLNLTRADMIAAGYSPSVRLFEAASCGVPVISDRWAGLSSFFLPREEILVAESSREVVEILSQLSEDRRRTIAMAARRRVLRSHTAERRARELETYYAEVVSERDRRRKIEAVA